MRPPRINFTGGVFHVVTRCNNREFFFQRKADFLLYQEILIKAKKKYGTEIYAYCITSNHVHLLVGTPAGPNLSEFMQYVNGNYAKNYNRAHKRTGRFWEGRFHSTIIESETQLLNTQIYIELNMTRNRVCRNPIDWPWSSHRAHVTGEHNPILDYHPLYLELGDSLEECQNIYHNIVNERIREKGFDQQPAISRGIIYGSESFVQNLLEKYGQIIPYYQNRKLYSQGNHSHSLRRFSSGR